MPTDNMDSSISGKVPDSCTDFTSTWIRRDCPCPNEPFEMLVKKKQQKNIKCWKFNSRETSTGSHWQGVLYFSFGKNQVLQSQWSSVQEIPPPAPRLYICRIDEGTEKIKVQHAATPQFTFLEGFQTYPYRILFLIFLKAENGIFSLPTNSLIWWATGISVSFSWLRSPWLKILTHWWYQCSKVTAP